MTTPPDAPILIVDDMPEMRSILVRYLQLAVPSRLLLAAPDAKTALKLARRHQPNILITDFLIPGAHGIELARQLRTYVPDIYVVLISVYNDTNLPFQKDGTAINAFLQKPFRLEALDYLLGAGQEPDIDTIHQRLWPPQRFHEYRLALQPPA